MSAQPSASGWLSIRIVGHEKASFELARQRQPASFTRVSAHPLSGGYWQCRPVSGRDRAAALNAGSSNGSGAYAAGTKTSMTGERP